MFKENISVRGDLTVTKRSNIGDEVFAFRNLVVETGIDFILGSLIDDARPAGIKGMAIGTDTTAVAGTDTSLGAESHRNVIATKTISSANNSIEFQTSFESGEGTGAITEAALYNSETTGGIMLARTVFPVINKEAGDQFIISWVITLALA